MMMLIIGCMDPNLRRPLQNIPNLQGTAHSIFVASCTKMDYLQLTLNTPATLITNGKCAQTS